MLTVMLLVDYRQFCVARESVVFTRMCKHAGALAVVSREPEATGTRLEYGEGFIKTSSWKDSMCANAPTFNVAKASSKLPMILAEARSVNNRNVVARRPAASISPLKKLAARPRAPKASAANLKPLAKTSTVVKSTSRR